MLAVALEVVDVDVPVAEVADDEPVHGPLGLAPSHPPDLELVVGDEVSDRTRDRRRVEARLAGDRLALAPQVSLAPRPALVDPERDPVVVRGFLRDREHHVQLPAAVARVLVHLGRRTPAHYATRFLLSQRRMTARRTTLRSRSSGIPSWSHA